MQRSTFVMIGLVATMLACNRDEYSPLDEAARSSLHDAELSTALPILSVGDLKRSQTYYREALGFVVDWEHGDPPDFGSVSRGDAVVFMCERCQGNPGSWIMIFAKDVDRLHDEFVDAGAIVKRPPTDQPWGLREMLVEDPDGNTIRFGSRMRH